MIVGAEEVVAKYIIQVNLLFKPGILRLGSFNLWKKGGMFGHADELMKFCPAGGCKGFFIDSFELTDDERAGIDEDQWDDPEHWPPVVRHRHHNWLALPVLCPECGAICLREHLPDSYGFNLTYDVIAERLADFYQGLSGDADILMVRTKEDKVFQKAKEELHSSNKSFSRYKRLLETARDRDTVFYPMKSIIKDTSSGGSLVRAFKSFLGA